MRKWYIRNNDLHRALGMAKVDEVIQIYTRKRERRPHLHENT